MNLFTLKPHPYSQIFPNIPGHEFQDLLTSIKKLGRIRNAVIVYQGKILDGNQRLRACKQVGVHDPKWIEFKGTDEEALDLVWDLNYTRRHLNESQRAMAAARFVTLSHGQHPNESGHVTTLHGAAKRAHVGRSTIQRAKLVLEHGTNNQVKDVREGKKTVTEVTREIREKQEASRPDGVIVDDMGYPVPEPARIYWNRKPEAKNVLSQIQAAKGQVKRLLADDPMWCEVNLNGVLADLSSAINRFTSAVPAYVCVYCHGRNPDGCKACKGRGVVSKFMWSLIPEELRKMREVKRTV